jgi:hypothetical protein
MKLRSALLLLLPLPILAKVGDRCSNAWGADCICLDANECERKWGGYASGGFTGNWPCPHDPDNVMACIVKPCPGFGGRTQCMWTSGCRSKRTGTSLFISHFMG